MSFKLIIPPWVALGFYRGTRSYEYDYEKQFIEYEKNKEYTKPPQYLYSNCVGVGLFGIIIYANPFFVPIILGKEIYRLEVNLRGLEKEKDKKSYYDLF